MGALRSRPNIFEYSDYRGFLADYYRFMKANSAEFSYRQFSKSAGFASPNFLKRVIDNDRNLTLASIRKIIAAVKMTEEEGSYFRHLVSANQAKTPSEGAAALREMSKAKVMTHLRSIRDAELEYYRNWRCIPIREMVSSPHFRPDPEWIAEKMEPRISAEEAREALNVLLQLGLIKKDLSGRVSATNENLTTGGEVYSAFVTDFHQQMNGLAARALERTPRYKREISGATVLLSETKFQEIKMKIQKFAQELLAEEINGGVEGQSVYQLNFQLFPLTQRLDEKGRK